MRARMVVSCLIGIVLIIATGLGFAAFSSSVEINGSAQAGALRLIIESAFVISGPSYVTVSSFTPASSVTVTIGPFAPGDTATVEFNIKNIGTLPATSLNYGSFISSIPGGTQPQCIGSTGTLISEPVSPFDPGQTQSADVRITAAPFGNACQGITFLTFTWSMTGQIGS